MEHTAGFSSFREFYPYYLSEHADRTCRRLHFAGTSLVILTAVAALASGRYALFGLLPVVGYGFAWVGHFYFEKNRPASFRQPLYSFMGDWVMYWQLLTGQISF